MLLLLDARLELDRVVDGEADEDRQDGDRGHREAGADERHRAERHGGGGECDQQWQESQAGFEQQQEGECHRGDGDDQQGGDPARDAAGECVGDDGDAGDRVGPPCPSLNSGILVAWRISSIACLRSAAVRSGRRRAESVRRLCREECGEAGLRDVGAARGVEDDLRDERLAVDLRDALDAGGEVEAGGGLGGLCLRLRSGGVGRLLLSGRVEAGSGGLLSGGGRGVATCCWSVLELRGDGVLDGANRLRSRNVPGP